MSDAKWIYEDARQRVSLVASPSGEVFLRVRQRDEEPASAFLSPSLAREMAAALVAAEIEGAAR